MDSSFVCQIEISKASLQPKQVFTAHEANSIQTLAVNSLEL